MTTLLPTDVNDTAIPALRLKQAGAHAITSSASSARNTVAFDEETRIVGLFATEDVYIKLGDNTVSATTADHFFPKNTYYDIAIGGGRTAHYMHLAVLQVSTGGIVYLSEKE